MPPGIRRSKKRRPFRLWVAQTRRQFPANMLLWLVEDLSEMLDCLLEDIPRLCNQVSRLKEEFGFLATQVLSSVEVWDRLQEIGHSAWVLPTWIDLWIPIMDLELEKLFSPLISLQNCLKSPDSQSRIVWALWAIFQTRHCLNQTDVGLLLNRFRIVEEILLHIQHDPEEWQVVSYDSSCQLPNSVIVRSVLEHFCLLIDVTLSLTEPHIIHSLFGLEEIWIILQNPKCWTFMENEVLLALTTPPPARVLT